MYVCIDLGNAKQCTCKYNDKKYALPCQAIDMHGGLPVSLGSSVAITSRSDGPFFYFLYQVLRDIH